MTSLSALLAEYERALRYTDELANDLEADEISWRPDEESSSIGWHLCHQPAVAHFMLRNLTAAEPRLDPALEALADSATPERDRGNVADIAFVRDFRRTVAAKVRTRIELIDAGDVGAPTQMRSIGSVLLTALINHEYQHDRWIGEVRHDALGHHLPELPSSPHLTNLDGYLVITS
ncbi:MAG: DinB family protein [Ilumatobacteraceae bacterium]|nr:DinB family protein [Ilumatobacteraceae bacterium]